MLASFVLQNATLFDSASGTLQPRTSVVVEGDRITGVGAGTATPHGARTIDLAGRTLLPGLIDAHTHLLLHPY